MAVLREKVLPRQESSHSSCSGARRSGMGLANGIGGAGCLTSVADSSTVSRQCKAAMLEPVKIIQISTNSSDESSLWLYALDSDGQVWALWGSGNRKTEWQCFGSPFIND